MALVTQRNGYTIRDHRGGHSPAQATSGGLYKRSSGHTNLRPRAHTFGDSREFFTTWDWQEQISLSRQIFARLPVVHGAVCQKNLYAVGCAWRAHYHGDVEAWGTEAEEYLNEIWGPSCDIRGEPYDFWLDLYLDACAVDRDGDQLMVFRRLRDLGDYDGPLRLQWIPSHRIQNGRDIETLNGCAIVKTGVYKGARICNGVIKDRDNTTIAYRVLNDDKTWTDLPANSAQLLYEPDWNDMTRGIPRSAVSCLDHLDVEDINHFLKRQVKQDSALGLAVENEAGAPMSGTKLVAATEVDANGNDETNNGDDTDVKDVQIEYLEGNEIQYFKSMTGGKITPIHSDRPSPNVEAFIARVETQSLFSVGWFRQLMDPSTIGGASVRAIQNQARHSVDWRQDKLVLKRAKRACIMALSDAMQRGVISANDAEKWWHKFTWTRPAQLTVDAGYDEKADLEHLRFGTSTAAIVTGKKGFTYDRDILPRLGKESAARIKLAQDISSKLNVPLELVLNDLRMANPNGLQPNTLEPEKEEKANDKREANDA